MSPRLAVATPILLFSSLALAEQPPKPTPFPPDSPRAAVERLTDALAAGDSAAIHSLLHAATPAEGHLVDAMAAMSQAIARLRPVAAKRYGDPAARTVTGDPDASHADQHAKLEAAYQQIEGDTARLTFADPSIDPVTLKRIDGRWVIPVSEKAKNLTPEEIETRAADLTAASKAVDEVRDLCAGGKWQTANDILIAIQERILKSQQSRLPATTPATAPASTRSTTRRAE